MNQSYLKRARAGARGNCQHVHCTKPGEFSCSRYIGHVYTGSDGELYFCRQHFEIMLSIYIRYKSNEEKIYKIRESLRRVSTFGMKTEFGQDYLYKYVSASCPTYKQIASMFDVSIDGRTRFQSLLKSTTSNSGHGHYLNTLIKKRDALRKLQKNSERNSRRRTNVNSVREFCTSLD
jgi:hypothetical protein